MEKISVKEAIVVEGRDDRSAVLRAAEAQVICTGGYGISPSTYSLIEKAWKERGIIILTDPDFAGGNIRKRLTDRFPGAKQAYIGRDDALRRGDVGVENASPEAVRKALEAAQASPAALKNEISREDMTALGLAGGPGSAALRAALGRALGIGTANGAAFLKRLNSFGVTREELLAAWKENLQDRG